MPRLDYTTTVLKTMENSHWTHSLNVDPRCMPFFFFFFASYLTHLLYRALEVLDGASGLVHASSHRLQSFIRGPRDSDENDKTRKKGCCAMRGVKERKTFDRALPQRGIRAADPALSHLRLVSLNATVPHPGSSSSRETGCQ